MSRPLISAVVSLALATSACSGSGSDAATETETTTSTALASTTSNQTTTTAPATSVTEQSTTSEVNTSPPPTVPLLSDVLEISAGWPAPVTLWDKTGARKQGHSAGAPAMVIEGPLVSLAEVPLQGWVYQREQESNVVYFSDGVGPERELLVGTGDQTLILEGVWLTDGDGESAEVIYQRYVPDLQNSIQTLRGYSMASGEVRELTVTGGFESATSFALVNERFVAARFYGEGHYELSLIDLTTGDRPYQSSDDDVDCFDGGEPACPEYEQAVAIGTDIFGFGIVPNESGVVDQMGIYRFDTADRTEELLTTYPWDNGAYYAVDMVQLNNEIAVSLAAEPFSQGLGEPLPAILFDIGTGQSTLAPEPGFVQPSWLS